MTAHSIHAANLRLILASVLVQTADLVGIVERTMHPTSVSLWLKSPRGQE